MTSVGQQTAPNLSSDAPNGVTYAYRRFGNTETTRPPLLCLQHYRGTLDNWDPLFIDAVAEHGEVILLDNAGVGGSTGTVPRTVTEMARDAIVFVDALGLELVDVLGFSLGGMVAQELTLLRPWQVRRLILAGTAPRGGGHQTHGWTYDIFRASQAEPTGPEDFLHIFFDVTETSRAKGMDYLGRFLSRAENRDADNGPEVARAQYDAVVEWGIPEPSKLRRLAGITQPTLVANGMNDTMIPSINSQLLADNISNARLRLYPDAGHGFFFQYPGEFAALVGEFLGAPTVV